MGLKRLWYRCASLSLIRAAKDFDATTQAAANAAPAVPSGVPLLKIEKQVRKRIAQLRAGAPPTPEERAMMKGGKQ